MVQVKAALVASVALFSSYAAAVTPLAVRGADFVNSRDGSRFQMIGVAYQPGGPAAYNPGTGSDPLSNADICLRDAILMQKLGMNTIRVYNLDPDVDHTGCASIFNAAGIYMILDVNSPLPGESLNREAPWQDYYTPSYMERVFKIVEAFMNFNNTLGFFAANEVINEDSVEQAPQFIRAVTRDIKQYINKHSSREIPVGYSAADVRDLLLDTFNYLECHSDDDPLGRMDFFGLNSYTWCGDATFESAQYDFLVESFGDTTVPVFFSEYGCNKVRPRIFTEVGAIYSSPFMNVFSGGMVYEWTEEEHEFGLVKSSSNRLDMLQDYDNLRDQLAKIDVAQVTAANSTASNLQAPICSDVRINSNLTSNFTVPYRPAELQRFIDDGVSGSFPTGTTQVSNTNEPVEVFDVDGTRVEGLQLTILNNDQSNLPNGRQSTDPNGSGIAPAPTPAGSGGNGDNAASRGELHVGLILGACALVLAASL